MQWTKLLFLLLACSTSVLIAQNRFTQQDLIGAWKSSLPDSNGDTIQAYVTITDGFYSLVFFQQEDHRFLGTQGGTMRVDANKVYTTYEFNTNAPEEVGTEEVLEIIAITDHTLTLGGNDGSWTRVDNGTPGALSGAWLISGRVRNGEMRRRSTEGSRKTMKILSGTRFQWIAYNTETKAFMGTGGGTYTTESGQYVETIDVFSRDSSRVGAELSFEFELIDGEWHHRGLSSKGQPIHEVWSRRE